MYCIFLDSICRPRISIQKFEVLHFTFIQNASLHSQNNNDHDICCPPCLGGANEIQTY